MTLKPIPVEDLPRAATHKQKPFDGNKKSLEDRSLKKMCLQFISYINKGSKGTYQQIDDLIVGLYRGILKLQKKKQHLLAQKHEELKKKKKR